MEDTTNIDKQKFRNYLVWQSLNIEEFIEIYKKNGSPQELSIANNENGIYKNILKKLDAGDFDADNI